MFPPHAENNGDVLNFRGWSCEICGKKPTCPDIFPNKALRRPLGKFLLAVMQ